MSVTPLQSTTYSTTTAGGETSGTLTLGSAATKGNALILVVSSRAAVTAPTGYTHDAHIIDSTYNGTIEIYSTVAAGGETSLTITLGATGAITAVWTEVPGLQTSGSALVVDQAVTYDQTTSSTTLPATASNCQVVTTQDDFLVFAGAIPSTSKSFTANSFTNSFVQLANLSSTVTNGCAMAAATLEEATAGTYNTQVTMSTSGFDVVCALVAYKVAGAPTIIGTTSTATNTTASKTLTLPSATQAGDLVIVAGYAEPANERTGSASFGTFTLPTGFTAVSGFPIESNAANITTQDDMRLYAWYGYAASTGTQSLTFTATTGVYWGLAAVLIRGGATAGNPLSDTASTATIAYGATATSTPPVSLTLGGPNSLVLWLYGDWGGTSTNWPSGYTSEAVSTSYNGQPAIWAKTYAASGATGTVSAGRSNSDDGMAAGLLSFRAGAGSSTQNLSGAMTQTGALSPVIKKSLSSRLSFIANKTDAQSMTDAVLGLSGTLTKRIPQTLSGAMNFGFHNHYTQFLNGTLVFGEHNWTQAFSAGLGFTGDFAEAKAAQIQLLASSLGFTGTFTTNSIQFFLQALTGGMSFTGNLVANPALYQLLSGGLSFAGRSSRSTVKRLAGGFSSGGQITRAIRAKLTGGVSFTGHTLLSLSRLVSGNLSFAGKASKRSARQTSGGVSFQGNYRRAIRAGLGGGLSFTGRTLRAITAHLVGSALSFSGSFLAAGKDFVLAFTASLGLSGATPKRLRRGVSGALSSSGAFGRTPWVRLSGAMSFAGAIRRASAARLSSALSFAGSVSSIVGNALYQVFTASVGFSGAFSRGFVAVLTSVLSFTPDFVQRVSDLVLTVLTKLSIVGNTQISTTTYEVENHSRVRQAVETAPNEVTVYVMSTE